MFFDKNYQNCKRYVLIILLMILSSTVIFSDDPGISIDLGNLSKSVTINETLFSNTVTEYYYNITNYGYYNKSLDVLVNVTDLKLVSNNNIKLNFDSLYSRIFVIENNKTRGIPFRFTSNSLVMNNPGTYTAELTFEANNSTISRTVSLIVSPAKVTPVQTVQNQSTSQNTQTFPNDKLQIDISKVYINGQSDGTDEIIGNKEDLSFGDEVDFTFQVRNLFDVENDNTTISYISYEIDSEDLDIVNLEEEEIDDEIDANDESNSVTVHFKMPNEDDLNLDDIDNDYEMVLSVTGEDGRNIEHYDEVIISVKFHQEPHDLKASEIKTSPSELDCNSDYLTISGLVKNFGTRDESNVKIRLYSEELNLDKTLELENIDSLEDESFKYTHDFGPINISKDSIKLIIETRASSVNPKNSEIVIPFNRCIPISNTNSNTNQQSQNTNTQNIITTSAIEPVLNGKEFVTSEETTKESVAKSFTIKKSTVFLIVLFAVLLVITIFLFVVLSTLNEKPKRIKRIDNSGIKKQDLEDDDNY